MVTDDDIVVDVSWNITAMHATAKLRYTNFIEMACPLFRRDELDAFMAVYDPDLVGYGVDWWFLRTLGTELDNRVAVVDEMTCINPAAGLLRNLPDRAYFNAKRLARRLVPRATRRQR
jgi:hypothetical protein